MTQQQALQLFEERKVRTVWDDEEEKWYFSIVDVVAVLTGTDRPRKYWSDLKKKLQQEGSQLSEKIGQLKMKADDGKNRITDVADTEQLFRIIQSIPSPKAEPFKQWIAQVAAQRIDQMQDPELGINQAIADYRRLGYSEAWINQRIKSIEVRKALTDEWQRAGVKEGIQYASLTDIITRHWSGFSTKEYKQYKGLRKENLRDNMTNLEIALNMLAEATATEISQQENPKGFMESAEVAKRGGKAARGARASIEKELGHSVVSPINAKSLAPHKEVKELPEAENLKS
jgi:prophage antirepressor-like protein